ncbi:MAG: UDP-N-acetylmuramate dehydrogenase [Flavobacteriales bacterium]|nr:UDP-N-acetylmuramate dehydrogenase [Flavobacteriales bacterium]
MILQNHSLKHLNTFGIAAHARYFAAFDSPESLASALAEKPAGCDDQMILGGGSNVLFVRDYDGLMLHNCILGKELVREDDDHVWVRFGAGEVWHEAVLFVIENGWGGVENLSLIPGRVGAAPMQNIGAYGVELEQVFDSLQAVDMVTGELREFDRNECHFGYRESVFKRALKGQYCIATVTLRLNKKPTFNTSYGAIEAELERQNVQTLSIAAISKAVINIRQSKLPDPAQIGNAGSFFKNPVIDAQLAERIKREHPNMPQYPAPNGKVKVAAGWLIDTAGWKGYSQEDYGVHDKQALVLVNRGNAEGKQIYELSQKILEDIASKFGIQLEREVNIIQ